ncbi:MAG TPA: hypothetical protein VK184_09285 [Nostocaceae cyanobacterium]|nr:hypothetical protein [Nostocaceae cyanobacterium]
MLRLTTMPCRLAATLYLLITQSMLNGSLFFVIKQRSLIFQQKAISPVNKSYFCKEAIAPCK